MIFYAMLELISNLLSYSLHCRNASFGMVARSSLRIGLGWVMDCNEHRLGFSYGYIFCCHSIIRLAETG